MPAAIPHFSRTIASTLEAVDAACLELRNHLGHHHLHHALFAVELLARECLNNGVIHGNQLNPAKHATLHLRVGPRWIRLQVSDQGPGHHPTRRTHSPSQPPAPDQPSGRGLALCSQYAARVRHNRPGNTITLWIGR